MSFEWSPGLKVGMPRMCQYPRIVYFRWYTARKVKGVLLPLTLFVLSIVNIKTFTSNMNFNKVFDPSFGEGGGVKLRTLHTKRFLNLTPLTKFLRTFCISEFITETLSKPYLIFYIHILPDIRSESSWKVRVFSTFAYFPLYRHQHPTIHQ